LNRAVIGRGNRAIRAAQDAGIAAYTTIMIDSDNTVRNSQSTCNAALYAQRLLTVTAGHGKADAILLLDLYLWVNLDIF
jgi:hypothetical protein